MLVHVPVTYGRIDRSLECPHRLPSTGDTFHRHDLRVLSLPPLPTLLPFTADRLLPDPRIPDKPLGRTRLVRVGLSVWVVDPLPVGLSEPPESEPPYSSSSLSPCPGTDVLKGPCPTKDRSPDRIHGARDDEESLSFFLLLLRLGDHPRPSSDTNSYKSTPPQSRRPQDRDHTRWRGGPGVCPRLEGPRTGSGRTWTETGAKPRGRVTLRG